MRRVTKGKHDRLLRIAIDHKVALTEAELRTLSYVASAWAADLEVTAAEMDAANIILRRFEGNTP
jgi:hypothetical protein